MLGVRSLHYTRGNIGNIIVLCMGEGLVSRLSLFGAGARMDGVCTLGSWGGIMFRKMRRHAQQLDRDECEEILRQQPRGVLSVLGDDEYPYGVPLDYVYEDGALWFHCATVGHKIDAIAAHDKASFCVLDDGVRHEGEWWMCFRSVIAFGRVSVVDDEETKLRVLWSMAGKYFPADYDTEGDIARSFARVAVLRFEIEHLSGKAVREK